jgi:hypothetical protein
MPRSATSFDAGLDRAIEVGAGEAIEHRTDETRDEMSGHRRAAR